MTKRHKHHNDPNPVFDDTGPSSSQTPYLVPAHAGVQIDRSFRRRSGRGQGSARGIGRGSRGAWSVFPMDSAPSITATAP